MQISLRELAEHIGGTVIGDPEATVSGLGSLDDALPGQITFLANPKYAHKVAKTAATAVMLPPGAETYGKNAIVSSNPYLAFAKVLTFFTSSKQKPKGVMDGAFIGQDAQLGQDVSIYPGAYIGDRVRIGDRVVIYPGAVIYEDVTIGDDVVIHANVSIRERCRVGSRVIIHCGSVIGSDGFGYAPDGKAYFKIPQIGIVVIEDDVEIGANTTIDRAALDVTLISKGVKIDNLVQIAHNCKVGQDTVMAAQSGIAGSSEVGRNVTVGGQVAISGHLKVCDNVMLAGRCGVTGNLEKPGVYSGLPPLPHKEWLKASIVYGKLPELKRTVSSMEKRIAELEKLFENK